MPVIDQPTFDELKQMSGDEFINGQPFDQLRAGNPFLLSVDEDRHELFLSLPPGAFFCCRSFAFRHGFVPLQKAAVQDSHASLPEFESAAICGI